MRAPIVAIYEPAGELDLFVRLNKPLPESILRGGKINTTGPIVNGGFAGLGWQVLGSAKPCYEAPIDIFPPKHATLYPGLPDAITVGPFPRVVPGMLAHISLKVLPGHTSLRAIVPLIAALPPEQIAPNAVSTTNPYARLLGCPIPPFREGDPVPVITTDNPTPNRRTQPFTARRDSRR